MTKKKTDELLSTFEKMTVLDESGVKALAALPSLDELRAQFVGLLSTPATRVAVVLQAPATQIARVLDARAREAAA